MRLTAVPLFILGKNGLARGDLALDARVEAGRDPAVLIFEVEVEHEFGRLHGPRLKLSFARSGERGTEARG